MDTKAANDRLAALADRVANDPNTIAAIDDYDRRVASGEGYPDAQDCDSFAGRVRARLGNLRQS